MTGYVIQLHNFKAFRDECISIRPLTVLSGLNGSGKSTLLQAVALLRQSSDAKFINSRGLVLNGELVELGSGADVLHDQHEDEVISISLRQSCREGDTIWAVKYEASSDVLSYVDGSVHIVPDELSELFGDCFQYLRADRTGPAVSYPKSHHVVSDRRFLGSRGEFTAQFLHMFRDTPISEAVRRHPGSSTTSGLLSQVNAWIQEFSPGAKIDIEEVERTDFVRLDYTYGGTAGISSSNRYRPTNVGFGLSYALPVVVACLASPPRAWVLIENPEAHLHPQGQVAMGSLLARAASVGVQLIVETHSDHVLNGIRIAVKDGIISTEKTALHFFNRRGGASQPEHLEPKITADGRLTFWPNGFFDQWDKSLDQLLD